MKVKNVYVVLTIIIGIIIVLNIAPLDVVPPSP